MKWRNDGDQWTYDIWMIRKEKNKFSLFYAGFNEYCYFDEYSTLEVAKQVAEKFIDKIYRK